MLGSHGSIHIMTEITKEYKSGHCWKIEGKVETHINVIVYLLQHQFISCFFPRAAFYYLIIGRTELVNDLCFLIVLALCFLCFLDGTNDRLA